MMTEKRFEAGNLKIQDTAPKGRVYLLDMQGGVNALCSLINGLNDKSNRLKKENEQLKKQIGSLEHTRDFCAECCERLEKENEELKSKIRKVEREYTQLWMHTYK